MKRTSLLVSILVLLVLAIALGGCPRGGRMMGELSGSAHSLRA